MIAGLLVLAAAPAAVVAAPPATATLLAKASAMEPAHKAQRPPKAPPGKTRSGCLDLPTSHALRCEPPSGPVRILDLDWKELLPEGERAHFTAIAPPPVHDYRGEGGPPAVQAQDFNVNKSLEGATVRLPGFIVPLEAVKTDGVSEFLLVPYFGSCIHVPPPAPNQIVYVHVSNPKGIESIYDAYWITGKLHLQTKSTRLGSTAYELSADKIEVYKY
jgi:hypothetical protein